ncbi:MAG TPA: YCF48-related protein, partial [Chitinophagales bacterium]|nr:YCF48-related protein [Chitinophagales bacterium]
MKSNSYFTLEREASTSSPAVLRKLLLVLFVTVFTIPAFSQWTLLNSGVTNILRAPFFTNSSTGYVVGEPIAPGEAIILKTTDGGTTWVSKPSGTLNALRGIHFIDDNTGFAVGFTGTILKTTNAGETWTAVTSGTTQALRSVYFSSSTVGYIAGGLGTMLKTTNGGTTWTAQTTNVTQDLINVRFVNNDVGYAVSSTGTFTGGIVIKTVNGGATWTSVYTNPNGLLGLAVVNANTVYAGGGNNQGVGGSSYIVKTTDGGVTWSQVYTGLPNAALRGAWFTSANKGWFVGDYGEMPATADGGATWNKDSIQLQGLLGIHFPNPTVGYAVGSGGAILKYNAVSDCPKPTNASVSGITSTTATVQWNAAAGAIGYKIIYHPDGNPAGIKKSAVTNSKVLTGL